MRLRAVGPALMLLAVLAAPAAATAASPGAPGLGDRLAPGLGNGGYDVLHYDLDLRYATSAPSQSVDGTVTILAQATQSLSRFNLDFGGDSVGAVSVDGRAAAFRRDGEELVITPRRAIDKRDKFLVRVSHFVATPTAAGDEPESTAFFINADGSATAPQPYFAHLIYPSNDHPRDKATFTSGSTSRPGRWRSPTASRSGTGRAAAGRPGPTSSASRWPPSSRSSPSAATTSRRPAAIPACCCAT